MPYIIREMDGYTANFYLEHGYGPECGVAGCRECRLVDASGYDPEGYDQEGRDRSGYDRNGYDAMGRTHCENGDCDPYCDCQYVNTSDERLLNYSYTPSLRFNGDKAPYYGMEIEVTTDNISGAIDVIESHAPRLIYCKEDSSVQGLEMVTHPMSYPWAMQNFPWDMLQELRTSTGATVIGEDNGIHVHVGRDGFDSSAHLYRWLKVWYRNPRDIQRIARRRASHWGAFNPSHRTAHKEHVKAGKPAYNYYNDATMRERYAAINTTNEDTLEVRVFASTLRPHRARAALQLVAGTVEYTRQLTSEAITQRHGWDWPAFISWAGKSGEYPDLMAENRTRRYL